MDADKLVAAPKVVLHDHLDGGLRPATVAELAAEIGHELPVSDPDALGDWFFASADSGSLVEYLTTFDHTVAVMQTRAALVRVAREFVVDLAADGVVYAEARWAPAQHVAGGLTMREAVEAVRDGLAEGEAEAAASGRTIVARQLVTTLRHHEPTDAVARLLVEDGEANRVAGFDIAGPEDGFPPSKQAPALELIRAHHLPCTLHAGEAAGVASIAEALDWGAWRIGHGARLAEDVERTASGWKLGETARRVREQGVALELCPSSNLQTGICSRVADHPFGVLESAGMRVTVNCDNRLMSRTTMSREMGLLADAFGYTLEDLRRFTVNAAEAAFVGETARRRLIEDAVLPGYARLGAGA
ncbi:MAG: adenosine deaminase [Propioniciclava sp.]|uniref:adenosine deaminase n=1 Tax=Propioniciclava sp. TaxID=2038686 RepID=UPI0039E27FCA